MAKRPFIVAGAGSWGTALAIVLARNNHPVYLWGHKSAHIQQLQQQGCNSRYLPDIAFPDNLKPVTDLHSQLDIIQDIVIAVPCSGLRDVLNILIGNTLFNLKICLACKGLASGIQLLNHQIISEYLGNKAATAVLSGPSFASEVAHGLPTAVTIASENKATAEYFAKCFHNEVFRTYTHDDIIGVQIGGAVKNVIAIAAGIADGLGFGANTRAAVITRGLVEIIRLGVALGARKETFMGLAGLGDLVLTCTDNRSRNRRLGLALGKGISLDVASRQIGQVIEGVRTAVEVMNLAAKFNIEMPISEHVNKVLSGQITPRDAVQALLAREPKAEMN